MNRCLRAREVQCDKRVSLHPGCGGVDCVQAYAVGTAGGDQEIYRPAGVDDPFHGSVERAVRSRTRRDSHVVGVECSRAVGDGEGGRSFAVDKRGQQGVADVARRAVG